LLGPLTEALEQRFNDDEDAVEVFVHNWLQTQQPSFFDSEIKNVLIRWEKCV